MATTESRKRVTDIFERILNGETFETVAQKHAVSSRRIRQIFDIRVRKTLFRLKKADVTASDKARYHYNHVADLRRNKDYWMEAHRDLVNNETAEGVRVNGNK